MLRPPSVDYLITSPLVTFDIEPVIPDARSDARNAATSVIAASF
jgi:hypothetical protein